MTTQPTISPDSNAQPIPAHVLKHLLGLFMAADPSPLSDSEDKVVRDFLDEQSRLHGHDGWVEAFHKLPRTTTPA